MRWKLTTCDKYDDASTGRHFCCALCEQKHFLSAAILPMTLALLCPPPRDALVHSNMLEPRMHTHVHYAHTHKYIDTQI